MAEEKGACEIAAEIVSGPRQETYGEPVANLGHIGAVWGGILRIEAIPPGKVALMLVGLKMVRESNKHSRDNLIDMAGYAQMADLAYERK